MKKKERILAFKSESKSKKIFKDPTDYRPIFSQKKWQPRKKQHRMSRVCNKIKMRKHIVILKITII